MIRLPGIIRAPIPIWADLVPCPQCDSDQVLKAAWLKGRPDLGLCLDCGWYWELETDNERENDV